MPRRRSRGAAQNAGANVTNGPDAGPDDDGPNAEGEKLTPYQGSSRAFGKFRCTKCDKVWVSSCTWANMAQKCFVCKIFIYPFTQWKLKPKKKKTKPEKPHLKELCQKCLILGCFCAKSFCAQSFCAQSFCAQSSQKKKNKKKKNRRRKRAQNSNAVAAGA